MIFFTETSSATILTRRAKRIRKATGKKHYKSQGEIDGEKMTLNEIAMMTLVRPFTLMAEPIVRSPDCGVSLKQPDQDIGRCWLLTSISLSYMLSWCAANLYVVNHGLTSRSVLLV